MPEVKEISLIKNKAKTLQEKTNILREIRKWRSDDIVKQKFEKIEFPTL